LHKSEKEKISRAKTGGRKEGRGSEREREKRKKGRKERIGGEGSKGNRRGVTSRDARGMRRYSSGS